MSEPDFDLADARELVSDLRAKLAEAERSRDRAERQLEELGTLAEAPQCKLAEAEARAERFERHFETLHRRAEPSRTAERWAAIQRVCEAAEDERRIEYPAALIEALDELAKVGE